MDGQPVGRSAGLIQSQVSCSHPLFVRPTGPEDKVSGQGEDLLGRHVRVLRGTQVPTHRQVCVLLRRPGNLTAELERVSLHLGEGLWRRGDGEGVRDDCRRRGEKEEERK